MKMGLRSRPWAGLDVGEASIKLVALQSGVGGTRQWVSELAVPRIAGAAGAAEPVMPPDAMARLLNECFTRAGLTPRGLRGITVGVSGGDVIVKQISLPLMDETEVGGALRFEARKHLPFDPATMVIDYQVLGRYPSEKRLDVLLAAVPTARLERVLAPLRLLGVDADIVDAAPLALTNALSKGVERDSEARVMLDFGHVGSYLTLYQKGAPYFSRRLDFGGVQVTQAISASLGIPFEEAEEWKLEAGSDDPSMKIQWDSREMGAVRKSLEVLAEELRRSFAFYRTLGPLPDPFTLWLSGNTARLPGIAGQLSELLDIPTLIFDPLDSLSADPAAGAEGAAGAAGVATGGPQFAQAYGLALRTA